MKSRKDRDSSRCFFLPNNEPPAAGKGRWQRIQRPINPAHRKPQCGAAVSMDCVVRRSVIHKSGCHRKREVGALHVPDVTLGLRMAAFDSPHPRDHGLQAVILVGGLAGVRVAGQFLAGFGAGDVHVVSGRELQRVLPVGNFVTTSWCWPPIIPTMAMVGNAKAKMNISSITFPKTGPSLWPSTFFSI